MSNKRRKLDGMAEKPQLSAIAVRKALATQRLNGLEVSSPASRTESEDPVKQAPEKSSAKYARSKSTDQSARSFVQVSSTSAERNGQRDDLEGSIPRSVILNIAAREMNYATQTTHTDFHSPDSREASPEVIFRRPSVAFSTFNPNENNSKIIAKKTLSVKLMPGEVIILGQCDLEIKDGQVTLAGAILKASESKYRIYAAASHSLPVIRCPGNEIKPAILLLHQSDSGIRSLESLSPLFGKLWNEESQTSESGYMSKLSKKLGKSTFQIAQVKAQNELYCAAQRALNGKQSTSRKSKKPPGVALLDLDPGQPEYSHPGQLSLVHIQEHNFGPPNTHPVPSMKSRLLRAHALGALSPSMDPSLYVSCALDLFAHYRNFASLHHDCPLIINTPGWVLGTGLEILVELIAKVRPSEVIYMSQEGPAEVVETLQDAVKTTPFITLPSQSSEFTTRTAAHLRTMQSMSYFHLHPTSKNELEWNSLPLASLPPWEITYTGRNAGILGIVCYGEQPPVELLAETINGSLVSIVVIEDLIAIPGYFSSVKDEIEISEASNDLQDFNSSSVLLESLQSPSIIRTPNEKLPYFNPANTITIDPKYSHTIGVALVRGIDIQRRRLQVLTPISTDVLEEINQEGKKIVLVSGKLDTPGWAYTEELVKRNWMEKEKRRKESNGGSRDEEEDSDDDVEEKIAESDLTNVPWVEKLQGSQGRGIGARVWRVRRDLGKMGDGD
ncbi:RNA processing protein [Rutstroemia sp. NJR-2017a BBW]|nr:RNA processing protein [Rutstroemia sp. NJR-2017a BBW]